MYRFTNGQDDCAYWAAIGCGKLGDKVGSVLMKYQHSALCLSCCLVSTACGCPLISEASMHRMMKHLLLVCIMVNLVEIPWVAFELIRLFPVQALVLGWVLSQLWFAWGMVILGYCLALPSSSSTSHLCGEGVRRVGEAGCRFDVDKTPCPAAELRICALYRAVRCWLCDGCCPVCSGWCLFVWPVSGAC